jgi:hypothetical protein
MDSFRFRARRHFYQMAYKRLKKLTMYCIVRIYMSTAGGQVYQDDACGREYIERTAW